MIDQLAEAILVHELLDRDVRSDARREAFTKVGGQAIKGKFTASKEKVTVPAGTYDAVHVKGDNMTIGTTQTTVEYWFAKDVGIVKLKFTLGSQDATLELESYTAGK